MRKIYRTYADTEVVKLVTNIECPYCKNEFQEEDMDECGQTYVVTCNEDEEGCGKQFKMYFDAS